MTWLFVPIRWQELEGKVGGRRRGRAPWEMTAPYQQGKSLLSHPTLGTKRVQE